MIRLVVIIAVITLGALGAAWLADRPGELVLNWQGYRIETSVMAAGAALAILVGLAILAFWLLLAVLGAPGALSGFFRARRRARGYQALSRGMIAVGAGDERAAARFASQAESILGDEPLLLLLKAQSAQMRGDQETARQTFEAMLKRSETETLGLRGLFVEAQRAGNQRAALGFAQKALETNPATQWAALAVFDMACASRDWAGALDQLRRSARHGPGDKAAMARRRAVLLTAQALEAEDSDPGRAEALALEAHGLAPELVPAAALAGRLLAQENSPRKAMRVLEKTWKLSPHPDIAAGYAHVRPGDSARDRLKRLRRLEQLMPGAREAAIAIAGAHMDAHQWDAARDTLRPVAEAGASMRVCALMAEIEEGQYGDRGRAREWMARAMQAPRDPAWTADGVVSEHWAPISPVTGRLDAFEWKIPTEQLDADGDAGALFAPLPAPEPVSTPVSTPVSEPDSVPHAAPAPGPGVENIPAAPRPAKAPVPEGAPAIPAGAKPALAGNGGEAPPVDEFPLHAPDDPGPQGERLDDVDRTVPRGQ